jgi:hypothetical protein
MSSPCRPSPCGRLSRPLTTTAAPTPPRFHRRIGASVSGKPATFLSVDSARLVRWRLHRQTQAALCGIPNVARLSRWPGEAGSWNIQLPATPTRQEYVQGSLAVPPRASSQLRRVVAYSVLRPAGDGGYLSRRSKPASFGLTMQPLSQAPPLGRLRRASRLPFRGSCFTNGDHPPRLRPNGSRLPVQAWRYWPLGPVPSFHSHASWRTLPG